MMKVLHRGFGDTPPRHAARYTHTHIRTPFQTYPNISTVMLIKFFWSSESLINLAVTNIHHLLSSFIVVYKALLSRCIGAEPYTFRSSLHIFKWPAVSY